jgi:hypothetical protein
VSTDLAIELTLHVPFFGSWFKRFTYIGAGCKNAIHVPPCQPKPKQSHKAKKNRAQALISGVFDISVKFRQSEFVDAIRTDPPKAECSLTLLGVIP